MNNAWEMTAGLEVHVELCTRSKIFCGCSTVFGAAPNTQCCPVCAAMPGALPRLNAAVVEFAVRAGLALGCEIARHCEFDRKNYFYPDLPKAYQISQLYLPLCEGGVLAVEAKDGYRPIGIREIHIEEDAGKLIHNPDSEMTLIDFNSSGVPLLRIVTNPDFRSAEEITAFLEQLRKILLCLGVSDCKTREGPLRVDVNLSVRKPGNAMGTRTKMKNLSSFQAVGRAVNAEAARQTALLEAGGIIIQETRRWDDQQGKSFPLHGKAEARDYRCFPEPDLPPLHLSEEYIGAVRASMPYGAAFTP